MCLIFIRDFSLTWICSGKGAAPSPTISIRYVAWRRHCSLEGSTKKNREDPVAVLLVYVGLVTMLVGFVSVIMPLRSLGIGNQLLGGTVLGSGVLLALTAMLLPTSRKHWNGKQTRIDDVMPAYHFHEVHAIRIHASPDRVFCAIKAVTPQEIRFLRTLMAIRSLGRTRLPKATPFLDIFTRWGYALLVQEPGCELVGGGILRFSSGARPKVTDPQSFLGFVEPGCAKVTLNFCVEEVGEGWSRVTTQTRILGTDRSGRRRFGAYWRVIYPGSAIIRRMLLRAIKRRAEQDSAVESEL
jgi:hypothetical protein